MQVTLLFNIAALFQNQTNLNFLIFTQISMNYLIIGILNEVDMNF